MAQNPLPDSPSSLSKYIPLEDHYNLLRSIKNDTTLESLKAMFQEHLVVTARKRYFTEAGGVVRRDKLIDLIQEEGKFTERVKMVMYFLFMFRDSRYRNFICQDVAGKDGQWEPGAFKTGRQDMFPQAGGRKAFTNLRQLLVGANLLTSKFSVKPFPSLESLVRRCSGYFGYTHHGSGCTKSIRQLSPSLPHQVQASRFAQYHCTAACESRHSKHLRRFT